MEFYEIGKPCKFHDKVDPNNRHSNYIKSKMNIVDIIPCATLIDIGEIKNAVGQGANLMSGLLPQLDYNKGIEAFRKLQAAYGLKQYNGIRLYLTDETTATDTFTNQFEDNYFQGLLNKLSGMGTTMRQLGQSINSQYGTLVDQGAGQVADMVKQYIGGILPESMQNAGASLGKAMMSLAKAAAKGNKVPLPKVWNQSSYNPGFNAVIKLVSPYGHPKAIAEYIIKPLVYLLLLDAPQTDDGVSYGLAQTFTLHAYGVTRLMLACISDLTLRRGGNDSSYNVYRQPLSIDVSIQFQTIIDGFGAFKNANNPEKVVINNLDSPINANDGISSERAALFQTVGGIVQSLRPIQLSDINVDAKSLGCDGSMTLPQSQLASSPSGTNVAQTGVVQGDMTQSSSATAMNNIRGQSQQIAQQSPTIDESAFV